MQRFRGPTLGVARRVPTAPVRRLAVLSARDYDGFLTPLAARREQSATRALIPFMKIPGMISLGTGLPNPAMFPLSEFSFEVRRPGPGATGSQTVKLSPQEAAEALQYGPTPGLPSLLAELQRLQQREHSPPRDGWSVCVTTGSQEALTRAFEMLVPPDGTLLVEDPTYSGALAFLKPYGCHLVGVATDAEGLVPEELERALARGPAPGRKPARVLYTIPTGQNPGGSTASDARRQAIYEIACRHNLLILEDDPYWFLYFGAAAAPEKDADYRRPAARSYLSMDREGRVLRMDSFSKVLSSGLRLGVATGPAPLVERLNLHAQATSLHASGLSQMVAAKLMALWGPQGWDDHVRAACLFYLRRRDAFLRLANKHLQGLATWNSPSAGMFVWMKILGVHDTDELIMKRAVDAKVLLLPGQAFSPTSARGPYVRAAFSLASESDMDLALGRLASLLRGSGRV